jgi:hypothetical protein
MTARLHWRWWLECESDTFADAPWSLSLPHPGGFSTNASLIAHRSRVFSVVLHRVVAGNLRAVITGKDLLDRLIYIGRPCRIDRI